MAPTPRRTTIAGSLLVAGGVIVVAGLSLADRVPLLFERGRGRVEILDVVSVPGDAFTFAHFAAWAGLAAVAAMTTRAVLPRLAAAIVLAAISLGLEVGQLFLTTTRAVEARDAEANLAGVLVGTIAGVVIAESFRLVARRIPH